MSIRAPDPSSSKLEGEPKLRLDGGVLACACPQCGAPMSVRLWLMVADCWRCGCSIELSEAMEQEALRLLEEYRRESAAKKRATHAPEQTAPAVPQTEPAAPQAPPSEQPVKPPAARKPSASPESSPKRPQSPARPAARNPLPVVKPVEVKPVEVKPVEVKPVEIKPAEVESPLQPPPRLAVVDPLPESRPMALSDRLRRWPWDEILAMLASMVVHLLLLILLALLIIGDQQQREPFEIVIEISASEASGPEDQGDDNFEAEKQAEIESPNPQPKPPQDKIEGDFQNTPPRIAGFISGMRQLPPIAPLAQGRGSVFAGRTEHGRAELVRREGGNEFSEAAVARGLQWLTEHQNLDGSWSLNKFHRSHRCEGQCDGQGLVPSDIAATALALLPYLGAGQTHRDGRYSDVVRRGLDWLIDHQHDDGSLMDAGRMYGHGQAAIVLCEAYALTQDPRLRDPAQRALDYIIAAQGADGGWRYTPRTPGDTSVVGWQLMAVRSGQMAGLQVPDDVLYGAARFLDYVQCDKQGGQYAYQRGRGATHPMTAEALLCRQYTGWPDDHPGMQAGAQYLLTALPDRHRPNVYYWYYATQMLHHLGGDPWQRWNEVMRDTLIETQSTVGHTAGSWSHHDHFGREGGRLYVTALSICTLEVYYRHLPLYRKTAIEP